MMELVAARGYSIESHEVTTADGYILTMFRIPSSKSDAHPVILQHGLLDSSYTWINNYADESLGYILSDAGKNERHIRVMVFYSIEFDRI